MIIKNCLQCHKEFTTSIPRMKNGRGKFCSKICVNKSLIRKLPRKNCIDCGKQLSKDKYTRCNRCSFNQPRSEEWKKKIGDAQRGVPREYERGENNPSWKPELHIDRRCSNCNKKILNIRLNKSGLCRNCFSPIKNTGIKFTEERKMNISKATMGRTPWNKGRPRIEFRGENNPNWRGGGITPTINQIIRSYFVHKQIVRQAMIEGNFTCSKCGIKNGKLEVDHIRPLALLIRENNIKTLEEAISCSVIWDINNLRILCHQCHKKTDTYMGKTTHLLKILNYSI